MAAFLPVNYLCERFARTFTSFILYPHHHHRRLPGLRGARAVCPAVPDACASGGSLYIYIYIYNRASFQGG